VGTLYAEIGVDTAIRGKNKEFDFIVEEMKTNQNI
jgi:hypothetical protein